MVFPPPSFVVVCFWVFLCFGGDWGGGGSEVAAPHIRRRSHLFRTRSALC